MMSNSSLQFALIGCGKIGARHAVHMNRYGKLIAVCDIDVAKATALSEKYSVPVFVDHKALLNTVTTADVVSVCTPNYLHAPQTIAALSKGFHVICEKPMAIHTKDCLQMIEASTAANRQLFIVKQNRFNAAVVAVKNALQQNKLGKILSFQINCFWNRNNAYYQDSWHGKKQLDGGTLFTQFSHFIDILYWLAGDVAHVEAMLSNQLHQNIIEFEDTGVVLFQMQNGATGTLNYTVNSYAENMEGSFTLFCEKGTVKIGGQYLNTIAYQNVENYVLPEIAGDTIANDYGSYQGSMSNHAQVYENVVDVLQHNGTVSTNAFEGFKTVAIIEQIYQAARYV